MNIPGLGKDDMSNNLLAHMLEDVVQASLQRKLGRAQSNSVRLQLDEAAVLLV